MFHSCLLPALSSHHLRSMKMVLPQIQEPLSGRKGPGCPDTEPPALASPRVRRGGARSISETLCSAWECLYLTNSLPNLETISSTPNRCSLKCLTCWHPSFERLLLNHGKTPGFLAPGGEEFNPGPETRLDHSELLCNKVLLKYKGHRESF